MNNSRYITALLCRNGDKSDDEEENYEGNADKSDDEEEGNVGKSDGGTFRYFSPQAKVRTAQFLELYTAQL